MEVLREIRVNTGDSGCYVRDKSSFHVNLNGLTLNNDERDKLFVRVENLTLPEKQKNVKFFLFVGEDKKVLKKEEIQHFELNYTSMEDLCIQLNCIVCNKFVYKSVCAEYKDISVELKPDAVSESDDASGSLNDGDSAAVVDATAAAAVDAPPDEDVVDGPKVDSMGSGKNVADEIFFLSYEEKRVKLRMAQGMMFFASCNLFLVLGFTSEVMQLLTSQGKSKDDLMSELPKMSLKLCSALSLSEIVHFFDEKEKICHIEFKKIVEPTFFVAGNIYSVLCSYDFEKKKVICNTKRLSSCRRIEELNFTLYDNAFSCYDAGCCLKKFPISFDLIICKKI